MALQIIKLYIAKQNIHDHIVNVDRVTGSRTIAPILKGTIMLFEQEPDLTKWRPIKVTVDSEDVTV